MVEWVCYECAWERDASIPEGHRPTWHTDECGLCEERKAVTEPRDFGKDRHKLTK